MFQRASTLRNNAFDESFLRRFRQQKLNDVSDTHLLDVSGDYHGTQHEKYVYDFDGVSSYVSVPNSAYSNPITSYELEITVRINNYNDNYVAIIGARNNANFGFTLAQQVGRLVFFHNGVILVSNINPLDEWVNIKITWDGNTINFYVDDILRASDTSNATLNINKGVNIGSRSENYDHGFLQLDGEVAYVRLLLNSEETIYNFEEGQGIIAYDASGNGNHGSLMNGVTHSIARDPFLTNYTNEYGYTSDNGIIIPRVINSDLDAQGNNCEFKGKVAADAKLINSNCINSDEISVEGVFNFDCTGLTITSKRGTASVTFDNTNDKIVIGSGTLYNLVLSNGYHFPLAEGLGGISYRSEDSAKMINWTNVTWSEQDDYHYNIINGFTDTGDGIKRPYKVNNMYSNPAVSGHNGAETDVTMKVFRESLSASSFHYDETDLSSEVIDYDNIVDTDNEVFVENITNGKINIETFLEGNALFKYKRKNNGFRKSRYSLFGSSK